MKILYRVRTGMIRSGSGMVFLWAGLALACAQQVDLEKLEPISLEWVGQLAHEQINESSGLIRSRLWEGVLWTHNDSGDEARLFAVDFKGQPLFPDFVTQQSYQGLRIGDAVNVDWEDIATDGDGNLYIAACGNNANMRRDLGIYRVREPNPESAIVTRVDQYFRFQWPDQSAFPPEEMNFDCEAIFWANGSLYLLTKHRSDTWTKLYRMDTLDALSLNVPTLIARFDVGGMVTGADVTPDGRRLAVLTYDHVWVFEMDSTLESEHRSTWFDARVGVIRTVREQVQQCEGITFLDDQTLMISNEQQDLFILDLNAMHWVEGDAHAHPPSS
ncbi:MAG: hypothetical protein ABQ298_08330 [Puniceicoccaceae bacterium]